IVQDGPYRLIRHPAYTGSILTLLGISLAFRSVLGIPATLLIAAAVYGYRIRTEEKALEKSFGAVYRDYEQHTWRLVPHVW
ncbi:MAG: isoprenylcysteine carboxylmethyltransferase family protein, partial [Ruminococcaceae bacterium]|nr:isoprenylcysteine carboxylmethyltransferase family protein [Oscillospiraceae bacterium]